MKKLSMVLVSASLFFFVTKGFSLGEPVFDYENLIALGFHLEELTKQTKSLESQLKRLTKEEKDWVETQTILKKLQRIAEEKDSIAKQAMQSDEEFKKHYPGYQSPKDFKSEYENNINRTQNTIHASMKSMRESEKDFGRTNNRLKTLQGQSENAEGQVQAIQVSNKLAAETVSQIELLRKTVIDQSSAQSAYYATRMQKEASAEAEFRKVLENGSTAVPTYGSSGHYITTLKHSSK